MDCVDRVNFTEAQQQFLAGLDDATLREETRDMLLGRQFRRDVFAKGFAATSPARIRARWLDTRFAMTSTDKDFDLNFETALGKLQLRPDVHGQLVDVLRTGPMTLRDAIVRSSNSATNWQSITDAIKVLVGRGDLQPALPAAGDAKRASSIQAFNRAVLARATESAEFGFLASPVTGGAVKVDRLAQLSLFARQQALDPAEVLARLAQETGATGDDGAPLSIEAARALAQKEVARIESDLLPMLKKLGIG
jgi:predicted methyltransferase family protein